jgi:hypothetical protein
MLVKTFQRTYLIDQYLNLILIEAFILSWKHQMKRYLSEKHDISKTDWFLVQTNLNKQLKFTI